MPSNQAHAEPVEPAPDKTPAKVTIDDIRKLGTRLTVKDPKGGIRLKEILISLGAEGGRISKLDPARYNDFAQALEDIWQQMRARGHQVVRDQPVTEEAGDAVQTGQLGQPLVQTGQPQVQPGATFTPSTLNPL